MSVLSLGSGPDDIAQAAQHLAQGGLVGLPTETVYGLAANADDAQAVGAIFSSKGRPNNHPLIVHVAGQTAAQWLQAVQHYAHNIPAPALALMQAFWPGPLTIIVPRKPDIGQAAAGGQDSIGLRCPSHPVAQAVLKAALDQGVWGLAAPSANRFGRVSPTLASHVLSEFADWNGEHPLLVLDGGACKVGIESTIVDASRGFLALLRPGMISPEALEKAAGQPVVAPDAHAPRASGTLASHYAPQARVQLMDGPTLAQNYAQLSPLERTRVALFHRETLPTPITGPHVIMADQAQDAAHQLFATLRWLDQAHVKTIWVQTPPQTSEWQGVLDRLQRAAAER